jgi:hypothetical protein
LTLRKSFFARSVVLTLSKKKIFEVLKNSNTLSVLTLSF